MATPPAPMLRFDHSRHSLCSPEEIGPNLRKNHSVVFGGSKQMSRSSKPESGGKPTSPKRRIPGSLAIIAALALVAWAAIGALAYFASHRLEATVETIRKIAPSSGLGQAPPNR